MLLARGGRGGRRKGAAASRHPSPTPGTTSAISERRTASLPELEGQLMRRLLSIPLGIVLVALGGLPL